MSNITAFTYPTNRDVRETEKHPTFAVQAKGNIGYNIQIY